VTSGIEMLYPVHSQLVCENKGFNFYRKRSKRGEKAELSTRSLEMGFSDE
jgi:hypothetical protein